jgi:hypothetical protein
MRAHGALLMVSKASSTRLVAVLPVLRASKGQIAEEVGYENRERALTSMSYRWSVLVQRDSLWLLLLAFSLLLLTAHAISNT